MLFEDFTHVKFYRISLYDGCVLQGGRFDGFVHVEDWVPQRLVTATGPNPLPLWRRTFSPAADFRVCPLRGSVDPRLVRFSAGATALTLAVVLLIVDVARPLGLGLLASQVAVFAFTAFVSFQWSLWAQIRRFIWPRIEAPTALEDARPPRFAQFLGFVFTALGFTFFAMDVDVPGYGLTAVACGASALNASTGRYVGLHVLPPDPWTATVLSVVDHQPNATETPG